MPLVWLKQVIVAGLDQAPLRQMRKAGPLAHTVEQGRPVRQPQQAALASLWAPSHVAQLPRALFTSTSAKRSEMLNSPEGPGAASFTQVIRVGGPGTRQAAWATWEQARSSRTGGERDIVLIVLAQHRARGSIFLIEREAERRNNAVAELAGPHRAAAFDGKVFTVSGAD